MFVKSYKNMNQAVLCLIIANVIASMQGFHDPSFLNTYKFQVSKVLAGEKLRTLDLWISPC